ncbi:hypothetical protein [Streptomyces sp. NPDC050504]|uniref:hypothetical protein n=1 Tax=Streptomyces sp. NPDC050504 TaxID=3365618 RepID=UPI00379D581B
MQTTAPAPAAARSAARPLEEALHTALRALDRRTPLAEAQIAVLEAALLLVRAGTEAACPPAERLELLGSALGAVRAAVQATSCTVVRARDELRRTSGDAPDQPTVPSRGTLRAPYERRTAHAR